MELKFEPVDVEGYTAGKILAAEVEGGYLVVTGHSGAIAFVPKAPEFQALGLELAVSGVDEVIAAADDLIMAGDELAAVAEQATNMLDEGTGTLEASDEASEHATDAANYAKGLGEDKPNGKAWKTPDREVPPVGVRLSRRGRRVHRYTGDATDALLMIDKPTACGKSIDWKKSDVRTTSEPINCPACTKAGEEKGK